MVTFKKLLEFNRSELDEIIKSKNLNNIKSFLEEWGLEIRDKKIYPKEIYNQIWKELYEYYDKFQLVKKILLNSAFFNLGAFN